MNWYEIPLDPSPQQFTIALAGATYTITLSYREIDEGGWFIDLADANNVPILSGVPLVTGIDLLEQYGYLDIGGSLYVFSDGDALATPTADNIGTTAHLYFAT